MFIRFGSIVFAASEFRRLEFNEDGGATLFLAGESDGIELSKVLADQVDRFFRERHEVGAGVNGLDVFLATAFPPSSSSSASAKDGGPRG